MSKLSFDNIKINVNGELIISAFKGNERYDYIFPADSKIYYNRHHYTTVEMYIHLILRLRELDYVPEFVKVVED